MKLGVSFFVILVAVFSCSDNDDTIIFSAGDRYIHEIMNCDNTGNPEMNCTEWLEFINGSEMDIIYGGTDIIQRFTYRLQSNSLSIEGPSTSSFRVDFLIRDSNTLERKDNGDIWSKQN